MAGPVANDRLVRLVPPALSNFVAGPVMSSELGGNTSMPEVAPRVQTSEARSAVTAGRPDGYVRSPLTAERGRTRRLRPRAAHSPGTRREERWIRAGHGEDGALPTLCTAVRGGLGPCGGG